MTRNASRALVVTLTIAALQLAAVSPAAAGIAVSIDVKPGGSSPAPINMRATDMSTKDGPPIPVALLSSPPFNALATRLDTICFGDPNNATQRDCTEAHGKGHPEDVDADGNMDLVLHFEASQTGLDENDQTACLHGLTVDGTPFSGCDEVAIKNGTPEAELPNLLVELLAEPNAADANDLVRWTATVRNDGLGAITLAPGQALLALEVPGSLSGVAIGAATGYGCGGPIPGTTTCAPAGPDTIDVGGSRSFTVEGRLPDAPGPVTVRGMADPSSLVTEVTEADNEAEAAAVVQAPNLVLSLTAQPPAVAPGDTVAWRASVRNDGPGSARIHPGTVLVRFAAPAGLTDVAMAAPSGFACSPAGADTYDCAPSGVVTLGTGEEVAFELSGLAPSTAALLEATATADPDGAFIEGNEADNQASAQVMVEDPNLIVSLAISPEQPNGGDPVEWTAVVTNVGPTRLRLAPGTLLLRLDHAPDLPGATIAGPAGYDCVSTAPRTFTCAATGGDLLAVGGDRTFRFSATAPATGNVEVTATADPANMVREGDETDNVVMRSTAVVVRDPDLTIALSASPDPVDAAHTVQWTARITNEGPTPVTVPSGARAVRFVHPAGMLNLFASTPAGYSCFIEAAVTVACATTAEVTIPTGGSVDFTLGGTAPRQPGLLSTTATVDPLDVVFERNETNNEATASVTVQAPDFSTAVTATPDPVDAAHNVTWNARITNDGPAVSRIPTNTRMIRFNIPEGLSNLAVSTPANYTCFISAPQVVECQTTATITLAVGATVDISLFGTAPRQPGPISVTVTADPQGAIPEVEESDNAATASVTVQAPDFSTAVSATPDPVDAAHNVTWNARITNDGPAVARIPTNTRMIRFVVPAGLSNLAVATPANYTCFISAPQVVECQTTTTLTLAVGGTVDISLFGTAPRQPGPISVTVTADPLSAIPEDDETDNAATASVTVQAPDFSTAVTATPDPVDAAHNVTWNARITNDGPAVSRIPTNTRMIRFNIPEGLSNLAVSTPANYTCFISAPQAVECQTTATLTLAVAATVDISLFGTAPRQPGPISVTVTADPLNAIPEDDEANNAATASVTVRPPDLSMDVVAGPTPVAPGDPLSWTATVSNDGPAVARLVVSHRVIQVTIPAGVDAPTITAPAGYSCTFVDATTVTCNPTSTQNLAVGGSLAFTIQGTASAAAGPRTLSATADPSNAIPEVEESDNSDSATIDVT